MVFRVLQDGAPLKSLNKLLECLEKPKISNLKPKITSKTWFMWLKAYFVECFSKLEILHTENDLKEIWLFAFFKMAHLQNR